MISASSLLNQTNPYESTIQQLKLLEELDKIRLESDRSQLDKQKNSISELGSRLSTLSTNLTSFRDNFSDQFKPLKGSSSDEQAIEIISASGMQSGGNFSISISQLAKQDIVLSGGLSSAGTDLSATGSGSFDITVGENTATISIDTTGLTNQEVMQAVADEVNTLFEGTLSAFAFNTDSSNGQLSLKSLETGSANRISITNVQGDMAGLNLANEYLESELDAQFTIDNVSFSRSSNIVDDAIQGLSFELRQTTTGNEQLVVDLDQEAAVENVNSFIENFNAVNSYIRSETRIDTEGDRDGILSGNRSIRNLAFDLRQMMIEQVSSLSGESISSLTDIGISLAEDGTMSIEDQDKLEELLKTNPQGIEQLFNAPDGLSNRLIGKIDQFITGDDNILETFETGLDTRIERFDTRIEREERRLDEYEQQLRQEFAALEALITESEFQFNQVLQFQQQLLSLNSSGSFF